MKKIFVLLLTISIVFVCACDYREIEQLSIATGVGVDFDETSGQYILSTEVLDVTKDNSEGVLITTAGDTIFEAMRNIITVAGKEIYFGHARLIVIGQKAAERGITDILDFFLKAHETRLNVKLCITYDCTAHEIMSTKPVTSGILLLEIEKQLQNDLKNSKTVDAQLYSVINMLHDQNLASPLPALFITEMGGEPIAATLGIALLEDDKLVRFLNQRDARAFMFATGRMHTGLLSYENKLSLEISSSSTTTLVEYLGDMFRFDIIIETEASVGESAGGYEVRELIKLADKELEKNIVEIADMAKAQGLDLFGFCALVRSKYPDLYGEIKDNWKEVFSKSEINVYSKTTLKKTGEQKSISQSKEEYGNNIQ